MKTIAAMLILAWQYRPGTGNEQIAALLPGSACSYISTAQPPSSRSIPTMIKLYRYLKPYWPAIVLTIMLICLQTLANLALPTLMANIVDKGVIGKDIGYIVNTGEQMLLITAAGMVCSIGAAYLSSRVAVGLGRDVRTRLFSRVESFSLHELDQLGPATLITRTTNDVTQVQMVTVIILRMMVMAPIMALGGIILALRQDATLTLVLVVAVPILLLAIFLIARVAIPLFRLMQAKLDRLNLVMREGLTGVRVIRAFNRNAYQTRKIRGGQHRSNGQRRPSQPADRLADALADVGDEPDDRGHSLVRRIPDQQRQHAGRVADCVHPVRHADHVRLLDGFDDVCHDSSGGRVR